MDSRFEDEYMDILQNIESAVIRVYEDRPALIDYDVEEAYDALMKLYRAQSRDRTLPEPR